MRIALVNPYHPSVILGGQERIVSDLKEYLQKKRGAEVELFSLSPDETAQAAKFGKVAALFLLSRKKWDFSGYDVIHAHGWASEDILQRKIKTPSLFTMHGTIAQYMENLLVPMHVRIYQELTQKRYEQNACDRGRHITSLANKQTEEMGRHYGCARKKIATVWDGIDTELFSPKNKEKSRERLGLQGNGKIVLACGRMSIRHKGFDILQKLAGKLGNDTKMIVNGTVPENLRKMLLPNMAVRTTSLLDMPYLYSAADLFVHPSRYEGFGLVTAEAMACGTPAVAFDTGAAAELIGNGEGGAVVKDVRDEGGFVNESLRLLGDGDARKKAGEKAAVRASKFTLARMGEEYFKCYEKAISTG